MVMSKSGLALLLVTCLDALDNDFKMHIQIHTKDGLEKYYFMPDVILRILEIGLKAVIFTGCFMSMIFKGCVL